MVTEIINASNTSTDQTIVEDIEVASLNLPEMEYINEQCRNQSYTELSEVMHMKKAKNYK